MMLNQSSEDLKSRPVWGAWIEMIFRPQSEKANRSRAPYGARGLKYHHVIMSGMDRDSRAPYGARGLK